MAMRRYLQALEAVARNSALPYGYTLTIWSSGALLMRRHGLPAVSGVLLFVAGAAAGFGAVGLLAARADGAPDPAARTLIVTGAAHVAGVSVAVGAVALVAMIHGIWAWPLAGFVATSAYLALVALELALVGETGEGRASGPGSALRSDDRSVAGPTPDQPEPDRPVGRY